MALFTYFILGTLLASCVEGQTAVLPCTDVGICTADSTVGDICETLQDGTTMECNCLASQSRVGDTCVDNSETCTADTNCANPPFDGGTCSGGVCNCGAGYAKDGNACKVQPTKPTVSLQVGGADTTDYVNGNSYTLVCTSTTPGNIPYTSSFKRGSDDVSDPNLAAVTQAANGGDYTCIATYDGVDSEASDPLTVAIKPAKPTLTLEGTTPADKLSEGGDYTLSCLSTTSGSTYAYQKDGSTASATLTSIQTSANGAYTCTAEFDSVPSDPSEAITIVVGASGKYCTGTSDCIDVSYTGACTSDRCVCTAGFTATGTVCSPDGKACTSASDCDGDQFTSACTDGSCVCESSYSKSTVGCEMPPAKPTLTLNVAHTDLSLGGSYTLTCTSAGGTTYRFYQDGTLLDDGSLESITSSNAGTYTCVAVSANIVSSDTSDDLDITVGDAGTYCSSTTDCEGNSYSGACTDNRCVCSSNYIATGTLCSPTGKSCSAASECTGTGFANTCSSGFCDCSSGYAKSTTGCEVPPTKPTLTLEGDQPEDDLSDGASYTLTCSSAGAADTTTYQYSKDGDAIDSGNLAAVSSGSGGSYTCIAVSANGVLSEASDGITIAVGAAGTYCTAGSGCTGNSYSGTCTDNRCACANGYAANALLCSATGKACTTSTSSTDCDGDQFSSTCTDDICDCATDYIKSVGGCETPPAKPTLTVEGGKEASDLSLGASYNLLCNSTGAADGTTYSYYKGTTLLQSESLGTAASDDDGSYTCIAYTANGAQSDRSDPLDVVVGAAGLRCTNNDGCTAGNGYTGTCTTASSRCACSSGYVAEKEICSSAVQAATISMFSILLAFLVSKLV